MAAYLERRYSHFYSVFYRMLTEETPIPSAIINSNQVNTEQLRNMAITKDSPCPCGSGKKYCECHGGNIRNIRRRRI